MTANPLGGALDHHICAVLDRSDQCPCSTEGVVDNQGDAVLMGQRGESLEVRDVEAGIPHGFDIDGLGVGIDLRLETIQLVAIGEFDVDPQARELHLELVVRAAVEKGCGNEIVAGLHEIGDGHKLSRLTRRRGYGCDTSFKSCNALFKHVGRGVH